MFGFQVVQICGAFKVEDIRDIDRPCVRLLELINPNEKCMAVPIFCERHY